MLMKKPEDQRSSAFNVIFMKPVIWLKAEATVGLVADRINYSTAFSSSRPRRNVGWVKPRSGEPTIFPIVKPGKAYPILDPTCNPGSRSGTARCAPKHFLVKKDIVESKETEVADKKQFYRFKAVPTINHQPATISRRANYLNNLRIFYQILKY